MKLLIETPTWLGDAVMATGAIEELINYYKPDKLFIFGSKLSTELFKDRYEVIVDSRRNRLRQFLKLPKVDVAISFRGHLYSKILVKVVGKKGYIFKGSVGHQVKQYSDYINRIIHQQRIYLPKLHFKPKEFSRPTLGINPGATYGSAKRWYPAEFAKVANELAKEYDIIIFGGPGEEDIAKDIEKDLKRGVNYKNLCGKLSIKELCEHIGGLELFITNDSGPMHIASAYNIPLVALFGPTNYKETSPYSKRYKIVSKDLDCAPCKKRVCPLSGKDYHRCMKDIKADDVLRAVEELKR